MLIGALALVAAAAVVCFLFFFKVRQVSVVNPAERYSDAQIAEISGINPGDGLMRIKTSAVSARIEQALPYVERAKLRRRFPDEVEISVEYARAALAVPYENGYALLSGRCKVLETGATALSDYVAIVSGVEIVSPEPGRAAQFTDPDMFTYLSGLVGAFADNGFLNVTAYDLTDLYNVTVEIDYKIDVKLGAIGKAESKLRFGKEVIDRTLADALLSPQKLIVDLTTEHAAYVRSKDAAEATSPTREIPPQGENPTPDGEDAEEDLSSVEPSEAPDTPEDDGEETPDDGDAQDENEEEYEEENGGNE